MSSLSLPWPAPSPCLRRNARPAMPMLISSLVSTSSSAHKVSPHCRFFFLKPGPIKGKNRHCFVPSTTRGGRWYPPTNLLAKESVGEMDVDDVIDVLEEEILEFMKHSEKPDSFPSKKELVCAGRDDLVDAIVKQGGWLSLGWDSEEVEDYDEEVINEVSDNVPSSTTALESDALLQSIKSSWDDDDDDEHRSEGSAVVSFCPYDDSPDQSASSPGSSLKTPSTKHETGIEGMLSRLERQRDFNIGVRENHEDYSTTFSAGSNNGKVDWQFSRFSTDSTHKSFPDVDGLRNSDDDDQPQMWRSWSIQRAGFRDVDIEDIEIAPSEASTSIEGTSSMDMTSKDEIITVESGNREADNCDWNELDVRIEKINHDRFIRNRLQQLELEASAVLRSVRSNTTDEFASQKRYDDLEFWEVQDSEISKAEDKLRSTRAKLAVLEGKMALAIIDARNTVEEKKKKIDDARRALRLVYSTCVVWPNSASSQVFLAGSFDGWATQRKMKKSSTGLFSLWLQLYPGQYEIKFIVDGEWRIDPLRPVVKTEGFENNLLIVS